MSKPPFMIPTIKGHELWPTATRTPAAVRIYINTGTGGVSGEAYKAAIDLVQSCDGLVRQSYLKFRQNASLGNQTFVSQQFFLAKGVVGRYVQNGPQETLNILVDANVLVRPEPPPKRVRPVINQYFMFITYNWSTGADLDTITRFSKPKTPYIGWAAEPVAEYKNYPVLTWVSGDNTTEFGPEVVYVNLKPIFDAGVYDVELELAANWYFIQGSSTTVTIMLFSNPHDKQVPNITRFALPSQIISQMRAADLPLMEKITFTKPITLYSQANPVQRVAKVQLSVIPPNSTITEGMKDYTLKVEQQSGVFTWAN